MYLILLLLVFILQWLSLQWENLIWFFQFHAQLYCIAFDCSCTDWNNFCDHLRGFPSEDNFKFSDSAAGNEFCEWVQVGIVYMTFIVNIRSILIHFHGFQVLMLLPYFKAIFFFSFLPTE